MVKKLANAIYIFHKTYIYKGLCLLFGISHYNFLLQFLKNSYIRHVLTMPIPIAI